MRAQLIENCQKFVRQELKNAEGGHDWFHVERVWKLAKTIARGEDVNPLVVELGALLHDVADYKFHGGDITLGPRKARQFLKKEGLEMATIEHVVAIIENVSFSAEQNFTSPELAVVQDADRLDALGAIGIARCFNYGGYRGSKMYDPALEPRPNQSKAEYKKRESTTINHFYEKLLLLRDKMNTQTGRAMAEERHHFMQQFYAEWEGKK